MGPSASTDARSPPLSSQNVAKRQILPISHIEKIFAKLRSDQSFILPDCLHDGISPRIALPQCRSVPPPAASPLLVLPPQEKAKSECTDNGKEMQHQHKAKRDMVRGRIRGEPKLGTENLPEGVADEENRRC